MNVKELEQCLVREGVDPAAYDLVGMNKDEVYCLEKSVSGWLVYYRERGLRGWEHLFSSEDEACQFLLKEILRDPTTRIQKH